MEKVKPAETRRVIKYDDWIKEAKVRFGEKARDWKFVCPACKTVQSIQDLLRAGVKKEDVDGYMAFSCIGRFTKDKGCDWTLGGLFQIHTLEVELENGHKRAVFEFAETENKGGESGKEKGDKESVNRST